MPAEIKTCRPFLAATIEAAPDLRAIVALGRIAHKSIVVPSAEAGGFPFAHGAEHILAATLSAEAAVIRSKPSARTQASARTIVLFDSYHCSRYNTNTGVLTQEMFRAVFGKVRESLGSL